MGENARAAQALPSTLWRSRSSIIRLPLGGSTEKEQGISTSDFKQQNNLTKDFY
jgi:hypothetical protein